MKTLLAFLAVLTVVLALPAVAAKKGKGPQQPATPELKIVEVDAVSIRVTLGLSGDEHVDYKITDATKITLNGAPVAARDLRPGMVAQIQAGPDKVCTSITAKDAPTHPGKRRVG
ncbi:MAG: hypothetical protein P4L99_16205 [Chthoniobacter sp.]|nr:hypothetical protein [Chthoniobacter sp.]